MVHDGSCMSKVDLAICSATFLITCILTWHRVMITIVEKRSFTDNYCAECMGSIGGLLFLFAAVQRILSYKGCIVYGDNLGIMRHAGKPDKPLPEKQSQGDESTSSNSISGSLILMCSISMSMLISKKSYATTNLQTSKN